MSRKPFDNAADAAHDETRGLECRKCGCRHLRVLYTQDLPGLWGKGHPGPANVPLPRYKKGDYPVSEDLATRTTGMSGWIRCVDGLIDQVADGIKKVVDQHAKLL